MNIRDRLLSWQSRVGTTQRQRDMLEGLRQSRDVAELTAALQQPELDAYSAEGRGPWSDRVAAVVTWRLHQIGTTESQEALVALIDHQLPPVRQSAAYHLVEGDSPLAEGALVRALEDPTVWTRLAAIEGLGKRGASSAGNRIGELLHSDSRLERRAAKKALRRLKKAR